MRRYLDGQEEVDEEFVNQRDGAVHVGAERFFMGGMRKSSGDP